MAVKSEHKRKIKCFSVIFLCLFLSLAFLSVVTAGERGYSIRFGTLSDYGKHFVKVNGSKISLCKDATILDDNDVPTTIDGLVATETVRVKVRDADGCAVEVKAITIRQ